MSKPLSHLIFLLSVLIMVYGQTSIYRISYVVALVFVLVALHQIIAPWFTPEEEIPELVEGSVEDFQIGSKVVEVLHNDKMSEAEIISGYYLGLYKLCLGMLSVAFRDEVL